MFRIVFLHLTFLRAALVGSLSDLQFDGFFGVITLSPSALTAHHTKECGIFVCSACSQLDSVQALASGIVALAEIIGERKFMMPLNYTSYLLKAQGI